MMAFRVSTIALYIAIFHISIVVIAAADFAEPALEPAADPLVLVPSPLDLADSPRSPGTDFGHKEVVFDVTDFGAKADGDTESSTAFLAAWEEACAHPGNSTLYIPDGTFFVGPVSFTGPCHNNQSPNVEIRGTLKAPSSLDAFTTPDWILFRNLKWITLTGGTRMAELDAQGAEAWTCTTCHKNKKFSNFPTSLRFANVSHGTISNISLLDSKFFHVAFHNCDNINVYGVNITAPWDSPNTDGIHISHSTNITITSSNISTGDDCVSIGDGSKDILVSNVNCGPGHGISVGSLGKYPNEEDVRGITVNNCTLIGTENGIRIKSWPGSPPSAASSMFFQNIDMKNVKNPIIIDQEYCPNSDCNKAPSRVRLSDIHYINITGTSSSPTAVKLMCSSQFPCQNVQFYDIDLRTEQSRLPATSTCENAEVRYVGKVNPQPCK